MRNRYNMKLGAPFWLGMFGSIILFPVILSFFE